MDQIDDYDYHLPADLIAQQPLARRSDARLLIVDRARGTISHSHVRDLPDILRANDLLVLNDTKVVPARLEGFRSRTGGRWTGLFLSQDSPFPGPTPVGDLIPAGAPIPASQSPLGERPTAWKVIGKTRGRLEPGESIMLCDSNAREVCPLNLLALLEHGLWLARPESDLPTWELLERVGRVPLPPYIRQGTMVDSDRERYQTVYARRPGAVAAPTAGLHFTEELLERLRALPIEIASITLHVGIGTFRPVTARNLDEHAMHSEWGAVQPEVCQAVRACRERAGRVIAVGTTVARVLESAAASGPLLPFEGETRLFIRPPFEFHALDGLLTNFHLPRSTLLVLVRTFGGDALIREAYAEAIKQGYRFYSYGDAMLIL
ncbi:MAG: tRNA preQ1(34) S-adenosylmethionine ribosyltransferase-isomerase QueA [Planctomycetes bacterium]|nr:tRNA preQ1(34) S-adenosylmethionine ribosyltransferase-isomerase QueA [Planctomycetota bacterium]